MPNVPHHYSLSSYPQQATANSSPRASYSSKLARAPTQQGILSALTLHPSSQYMMNKVRSFDCFRSFHGHLAATTSDTSDLAASSSSAIQVAGRHHLDREEQAHDLAFMQHLSAPVDVARPCSHWRNCTEERSRKIGGSVSRRRRLKDKLEKEAAEAIVSSEEEEDEEEEEEEEEEEQNVEEEKERLPPHEELAREWAASTSCGGSAFSLCQGVGRTLKGRDLCRVRNAILKQTGFIS